MMFEMFVVHLDEHSHDFRPQQFMLTWDNPGLSYTHHVEASSGL